MSTQPEAVYFSNRAACQGFFNIFRGEIANSGVDTGYVNYSPPQHDRVVADCDEALRIDPTYVKALNRRANALEALGRLEEAVRGLLFLVLRYEHSNQHY